MLKSFIRSLTNSINNNRKDIKTSIKLSACITAFVMLLITMHPTLVAVYEWFQGLYTVLGVMGEQALYSLRLWVFRNGYELYTFVSLAYSEWKTTSDAFLTLPFIEQTRLIIDTFGHLGTAFLLFTCILLLSIPIKILFNFIYDLIRAIFGKPKSWAEIIHENNQRMNKKNFSTKASPQVMAIVKEYRDKHPND
jgi:hypothetical protein